MKNPHNKDFTERAQAALELSVTDPTPDELARMAAMRQQALNTVTDKRSVKRGWYFGARVNRFAPAMFAACIVFAFGVVMMDGRLFGVGSSVRMATSEFDSLELLTADVDLELLENDLEFYQWMSNDLAAL